MKNNSRIQVLIVDDEKLARNRIRFLLEKSEKIEIIGESKNGLEAYNFLQTHKPDLVFLDIQMPEMTGLELIETIGASKFPPVIFVTAYDQYAIKAFELCAVDYLLKPFQVERLESAIAKAVDRIHSQSRQEQKNNIKQLIEKTEAPIVDRFFIKEAGFITLVETKEIDYIESSGNYVTIHSKKKSYLHRQTMKHIEQHLDQSKFVRVHRSYIVKIDKISSLKAISGGDYSILLKNGETITLSRRYKENLEKQFKL